MKSSLTFFSLVLILCLTQHQASARPNSDFSVKIQYLCVDKASDTNAPMGLENELSLIHQKTQNLGYQPQKVCWNKIVINLESKHGKNLILEHQEASTDEIELFQLIDGNMQSLGKAGVLVDFKKWPYSYRLPSFPVPLHPGSNEFYSVQSSRDLMVLGWKFYDPDEFRVLVDMENLLLGGFFAICFALALYNLVIFGVNKVASHLYYCFYLGSYAIAQLFIAGFLKQYFANDNDFYNRGLGMASVSFALFWTYLFIYEFLDAKTYPKIYRYPFLVFMYLNLVNLVINLSGFYSLAAEITLFTSAAGSLAAATMAVLALRFKHPSAGIFAVAWSALIIGNAIQVFSIGGVIESTPFTRAANYLGATTEAILLSYALAHNMRREKLVEIARRNHAFKQLEKMVYPHQLELIKDGASLETTMPIGKGHAWVICFDVVASSKLLPIHGLKEFLRSFFEDCQNLMNQNYDGEKLSGYAFRIKELGDGFLCSIGFPFSPPLSSHPAHLAMELAFDFVQRFDLATKALPLPASKRPCCSIGVAEGNIEGFFPLSGIRSYELFGSSIILATRYESLRHSLEIPGKGHVISIQESVYQSLSRETQARFASFELDHNRFRIRDDEKAPRFYYSRILPVESRFPQDKALQKIS